MSNDFESAKRALFPFAGNTPDIIVQRMKAFVVLLAASGLLLASQRPAEAQVSWGIPLPFPFLFYNFNQGYQRPQPYYGNQLSITVRAIAALATAPPRGTHSFIAPTTSRAIITDHSLAIIMGHNRATTDQAGAGTEVGKRSLDARRQQLSSTLG
jgi:hypothetical protein